MSSSQAAGLDFCNSMAFAATPARLLENQVLPAVEACFVICFKCRFSERLAEENDCSGTTEFQPGAADCQELAAGDKMARLNPRNDRVLPSETSRPLPESAEQAFCRGC